MKIERFEDIEAWQLPRDLANAIYDATEQGAFRYDFKLSGQIRDAAGSAMHNTAEGFDAGRNAEFLRFLRYSYRSCSEIRSELYPALDRKYITPEQFTHLYDLAGRTKDKIGGFIKYLRNQGPKK